MCIVLCLLWLVVVVCCVFSWLGAGGCCCLCLFWVLGLELLWLVGLCLLGFFWLVVLGFGLFTVLQWFGWALLFYYCVHWFDFEGVCFNVYCLRGLLCVLMFYFAGLIGCFRLILICIIVCLLSFDFVLC